MSRKPLTTGEFEHDTNVLFRIYHIKHTDNVWVFERL